MPPRTIGCPSGCSSGRVRADHILQRSQDFDPKSLPGRVFESCPSASALGSALSLCTLLKGAGGLYPRRPSSIGASVRYSAATLGSGPDKTYACSMRSFGALQPVPAYARADPVGATISDGESMPMAQVGRDISMSYDFLSAALCRSGHLVAEARPANIRPSDRKVPSCVCRCSV